ncbi:hypothetical protein A33M_2470 [Rhodovulum sp. PH10]|nr:hypothetical protein A33M_2470 [Rhodovulum sp. PH10]
MIAPDQSRHVSDALIHHVWTCDECGTAFSTLVRFDRWATPPCRAQAA